MPDRTVPDAHAREDRNCTVCGRRIEWRKKWARDWDNVKYCSDACRRRGRIPDDAKYETTIRDLLDGRRVGATICPSDVARAVHADDWRDHMEDARMAARRLVADGEVVITQGGHVVDASTAKGAIRIRRR